MTPIQKSVTVPLSPDAAFDLFTRDISRWWPAKHTRSGKSVQIEGEPHPGGRITEIAPDGNRFLWGWDVGRYLSFTWHPGAPEDQATIVAVSFITTKDGTRVDLTQGGFDVLGDLADAVSTTYLRGWALVLGCYHSFALRELMPA